MPGLYHELRARCGRPIDRLTRRAFVRQSIAAAGGLLLSQSLLRARQRHAPTQLRVVVVGAGLAGLACAHELNAAGYTVSVLEARDRVGGRAHTLRNFVPNKTVEAGGEFIGSNHPAWLAYAKRYGLDLAEVPSTHDISSPVVLEGKRLSKLGVIALFADIEQVYAKITDAARPIDADKPWLADDAKVLDELSMAAWLDQQQLRPLVRRALECEFSSYSGVSTERESFLGMLTCVKGGGLERYWTENEVFRCAGGNQQLAQSLSIGIGRDRVLLGTPVDRITITDAGGLVRTAAGKVYEADDVVLAVPPSTWTNIHFEPALPAALAPQMGHNVKYLAALTEAIWARSKAPATSMSDGPIGFTWGATEGQVGGPEQALTAFAGAKAADDLAALAPLARDALVRREVDLRFPGFSENILRTQFVDWPGQKWTRGSYSTPAPGQVTRDGPVLAEGLGRLHFAGEHCSLKFVGFMEGALDSGAAVARRLAARDGIAR